MHDRILIITDNVYLANQVKKVFIAKSNLPYPKYAISPFSNTDVFEKSLEEKILVYDLKRKDDIQEIRGTYNLILSIHCKQLFPKELVENVRCVNIHPGYNPINRGWYPQVFAIIKNLPVGATIHEMDEKLDHGPIIARSFVEKKNTDTSETLYKKIIEKEIQLLFENIESIVFQKNKLIEPEEEGEVFLKKDFNELCKLDLEEKLSTMQFINKLRALSHGDFKNAYFVDPQTQEKIYVKIELSK